jgi:transposase
MDDGREQVVSSPAGLRSAEERMPGTELVREMAARRERGEGIKRIARELGADRKTVKRWLKLGAWQPRQPQRRERQRDRFAEFIERRAPEAGFNGVVLYRELRGLGFTGGLMQVQRFVRPYREQRRWPEWAALRCETGPGEQAQADYGQLRAGSGAPPEKVHLFVMTLGYSHRLDARA